MVDPRAISTCIEEAVFEERQRAGFSILLDTEVEEMVGKRVSTGKNPNNKLLYRGRGVTNGLQTAGVQILRTRRQSRFVETVSTSEINGESVLDPSSNNFLRE